MVCSTCQTLSPSATISSIAVHSLLAWRSVAPASAASSLHRFASICSQVQIRTFSRYACMGTTRCGPVSVFVRVWVKTGFRMQHPLENAILKIQDVGWLMYLRGPFFVIMRCRDFQFFSHQLVFLICSIFAPTFVYFSFTFGHENLPPRSIQPCIPPGSLNRVPASAGVRVGIRGWQWHASSRSGEVS